MTDSELNGDPVKEETPMSPADVLCYSDMIRELRRLEFAVRDQEVAIGRFLAGLFDAPVDWPRHCKPDYTSREIVEDLIAPLNGDVFDAARLNFLCRQKRPQDYPRFRVYDGLKCLLHAHLIQPSPGGGYKRVHSPSNEDSE